MAWLATLNPHANRATTVTVRLMLDRGNVLERTLPVPGRSRRSVELAEFFDLRGDHAFGVEVECDEYLVNTKKYTVKAEDYDVTASVGATFETPLLKASDQLSDGKSTLDAMRETYDDHDHEHGGDAGTTDKPNQQM